ncbi:MAG: hypothetical protein H7338_24070 [Candidatus Sericytochromatia bacterium]|nr:hypothetical protein [Candidatus Sericytochromatia bacterium]
MPIPLDAFAGASAGPADMGPGQPAQTRPTYVTVGDSVMWGQGLRPENRFRERVRQDLSEVRGFQVVELSMARSGAVIQPAANDDRDHPLLVGLNNAGELADHHYSPDGYQREIPMESPLSILGQLKLAHTILLDNDVPPEQIEVVLVNGGINDFGATNIISPLEFLRSSLSDTLKAPLQGMMDAVLPLTTPVRDWPTWLVRRAEAMSLGERLETLLETALSLFPEAMVVITGYYPLVSAHSCGNAHLIQLLALLHTPLSVVTAALQHNLALTAFLDVETIALAGWERASSTWVELSNTAIQGAVDSVRRDPRHAGRRVAFAPSKMAAENAIFASEPWLWGFSTDAATTMTTLDRLLNAMDLNPEDEVAAERCARYESMVRPGPQYDVIYRLASVGHPNALGAGDYAASIRAAMAALDGVSRPVV